MDIQSFLMRLFATQKWREQEAQKLSTGAGYQPYSFGDGVEMQFPALMDTIRAGDNKEARREKVIGNIETQSGKPLPNWFHERWRQKEWLDQRQESLQNIFNQGI